MKGLQNVMPTMPVRDLERARNFYRNTLKLKNVKSPNPTGELVFDCGGGTYLYLYQRDAPTTSDQTSCSFQVRNLAATMTELRSRGVVFEEYDFPGLRTIDGVADMDGHKSAWLKDPDGNILALGEGSMIPTSRAATNGKARKTNGARKTANGSRKAKTGGKRRTVAARRR